MNFPPRQQRRRHAKDGADEPDEAIASDHEIREIVRLREVENNGFFMIASLLDMDERVVKQVYYQWVREQNELKHSYDVKERQQREDEEDKITENDYGKKTNEGCDKPVSKAVGVVSNDAPLSGGLGNIYPYDDASNSCPPAKLSTAPLSHNYSSEIPELLELDNLPTDLHTHEQHEMAGPSRFPAMQRTPKSCSPSFNPSAAGSQLSRAAKRAASSKASSPSGDGGEKTTRLYKRLKLNDDGDVSPTFSEGNYMAMEVDSQTAAPPLLPANTEEAVEATKSSPYGPAQEMEDTTMTSDNNDPQSRIQAPSPEIQMGMSGDSEARTTSTENERTKQIEKPEIKNSSEISAAKLNSTATNVPTKITREGIIAPNPARVKDLERLFFGPRPQRLLTMEEMSRFIDPMKLTRFNPALRRPAKKDT
ncbi:hypothetical protein TWF696_008417 [Orbilia brochopaga]|uniref:Uncharacterized protein n=1 Tax=Orbilia brochopaga TaxID=3140254 RepID=A0AAV9UJJ2_9PEZI